MVFLTLFSRISKAVAPFGLKHGLSLRYKLSKGAIRDNPTLDMLLMLPLFQKLLSQEVLAEASSKQSEFDKLVNRTFDRMFGADKTQQNATSRLAVLERHLRPVLVPNEKWSDVQRWMFHTRFLKFARTEYMLARYTSDLQDAMNRYPKLRRCPQIASRGFFRKMMAGSDKVELQSTMLPSSTTIMKAFKMTNWKRTKDVDAIWNRMTTLTAQLNGHSISIPGTSMRFPILSNDTDLTHLSLEDILELAGGHVASCGPFNALCDECNIFQLWTQEYINGLTDYLHERSNSNTIVLDVGAGDGLLAQLLREQLQIRHRREFPKVIAIDDGSWSIRKKADVERLSVAKAVKKYASSHHVIVLCSWMPMGIDWTAVFRKENVDEYILIGEFQDGNCGDNWKTWGNPEFRDSDDANTLPPFKADGYNAHYHTLKSLAPHSFSIFDSRDSANTTTVSFRRVGSK